MSPSELTAAAPTAPTAPVTTVPTSASRPLVTRRLHRLLCLLPILLIAGWMAAHWRVMYDGAGRLASAQPGWLLAGLCATCLCWAAAACIRQGAVLERLPLRQLYATQFAAGAANHLLPGGLGAHAVTLRFLTRRGIPMARATASIALYTLVKPTATVALLAGLLAVHRDGVALGALLPGERGAVLAAVGVAVGLVLTALLLTFVRPLRRIVGDFLRTARTDARLLHTRPRRVLALWGGAVAFPLLQASVLACVGASLDLALPWSEVVIAYLVADLVGGLVPTPGGLGSVDAALALALTGFGAAAPLAAATVIGYRVLNVWLPLLPGALTLSALVRRKVL